MVEGLRRLKEPVAKGYLDEAQQVLMHLAVMLTRIARSGTLENCTRSLRRNQFLKMPVLLLHTYYTLWLRMSLVRWYHGKQSLNAAAGVSQHLFGNPRNAKLLQYAFLFPYVFLPKRDEIPRRSQARR